MKTVEDYIKEAYLDCYINEKQVPLTTGLVWFNRAIHDFERKLVQYVKTNFFVNKIQSNLVSGTYIYDLPGGTSDGPTSPLVEQLRHILQIWVKYSDIGDYRRAVPLSPTMNQYAPDFLGKNATVNSPFFELIDNKVRIYPTPIENVSGGLQLDYQIMKKDYELTDDENSMNFPRQDITPVLHKLRTYIFNARGKYEEKAQAEFDFIQSFKDVTIAMTDIYCSPVEDQLPPLSNLTY